MKRELALIAGAEAKDDVADEFVDQIGDGDTVDTTAVGDGDEALDFGKDDKGEHFGVAGDDETGCLTFADELWTGGEGLFAGLDQGRRWVGLVLGGEHVAEQGGMADGKVDDGPCASGQALIKGEAWAGGGVCEGLAELVEAVDSEGVEQVLFGKEVAAGCGVADAEFAADLA